MRLNASKTASVYLRLFFRIGTFQWVTANSDKVFRLLLCGPSAISDETAQVAKTQRPLSEGRREQLVNRSWLQQKMLIRISLLCNEMFGHQSLRPWGADVLPWIDLPRTRSGRRNDDCRVQRRFCGSGLDGRNWAGSA